MVNLRNGRTSPAIFADVGTNNTLGEGSIALFSMPRGGKTARFVGSQWEGYIVVVMVCVLGLGLLLTITGAVELIRG